MESSSEACLNELLCSREKLKVRLAFAARSCSLGMRLTIWDIDNEEERVALKAQATDMCGELFASLAAFGCDRTTVWLYRAGCRAKIQVEA